MQTIATHTTNGAYGYLYSVSVEAGTKHHYGRVRGFRWSGNEGGMGESRGRIPADVADCAAAMIREAATGARPLSDAGQYLLEAMAGRAN